MLAMLFLGDETTTNDVSPDDDWVEVKRVDTVKLDSLGKLLGLRGSMSGDPLDPTGEQFVIPVSAKLVAALAKLDAEQRGAIAKKWAATEEWKLDRGNAEYVGVVLGAMVAIAKRAIADEKTLYLWWSL